VSKITFISQLVNKQIAIVIFIKRNDINSHDICGQCLEWVLLLLRVIITDMGRTGYIYGGQVWLFVHSHCSDV
jgi:hypothetical protein